MPVSNSQNTGNAAFDIIKAVVRKRDAVSKRGATLRKADQSDLVLVYDVNGNVIGACDPDDITPFANSAAPAQKRAQKRLPLPPRADYAKAFAAIDKEVAARKQAPKPGAPLKAAGKGIFIKSEPEIVRDGRQTFTRKYYTPKVQRPSHDIAVTGKRVSK